MKLNMCGYKTLIKNKMEFTHINNYINPHEILRKFHKKLVMYILPIKSKISCVYQKVSCASVKQEK